MQKKPDELPDKIILDRDLDKPIYTIEEAMQNLQNQNEEDDPLKQKERSSERWNRSKKRETDH